MNAAAGPPGEPGPGVPLDRVRPAAPPGRDGRAHQHEDERGDQPEAEQELADGYHIEYSGMKWGLFFVGEYIGIVLISALLVTLFFGGWHGPWLPPVVWFALKTGFFMMLFILLRASLPRPRYDQVMSFGWKVCLPLTLLNLLVTGAMVLLAQ